MRDFAPHEIQMLAGAPEVNDGHHTFNCSACVVGEGLLHPQRKHIVIDGRLRQVPSPMRLSLCSSQWSEKRIRPKQVPKLGTWK